VEPRKGLLVIAGRYTLEREIGRGGAGVVHLARDEVLGRAVAIKRMGLLPGTTEDDVVRAEREARLAAGINHQHVVSILDLVKDEDCYWLVMEHVAGRTLTELVAAEGPLSPERAAGLLAQAADGLVEANKAGIVHRDVKPSNIMVSDSDHVKLGDFGIARAASDAALTRTGLVTGSPAYLAPEVASGSDATAASDVWSLGATLFHAVVGRAPYDMGQNVLGGLYRIVHDDPPRLPEEHPLAGVLANTMTKDPAARWPVARVRDELARIARGGTGPGVAVPPPVPEGQDTTVAMSATRTASQPVVPIAPPVARPAPTPVEARTASRGVPLARIAGAAALVLLLGLGAWLLWPDGDEDGSTAAPAADGQSREPQPPAESSTSQEPTDEPTEDPTTDAPAPAGDAAAMESFVQDYFSQVTSDPEATFAMLTPQFQTESGGYGRYSGFWSTIESATTSDVRADPEAMTVSYTIEYVTASGRTTTEAGRLQLQQSGDGYLVAGQG
jgi:serine/threonine protein kinase